MNAATRSDMDPATAFRGDSLPLVPLLALAATIKQPRGRTRVNEFRVLLFAVTHAGFYPKEVSRALDLQTDGAMNEIYRTLKQMELIGLLKSQRRGNGRIYYCTRQGRREAATLGATLIEEANVHSGELK